MDIDKSAEELVDNFFKELQKSNYFIILMLSLINYFNRIMIRENI